MKLPVKINHREYRVVIQVLHKYSSFPPGYMVGCSSWPHLKLGMAMRLAWPKKYEQKYYKPVFNFPMFSLT